MDGVNSRIQRLATSVEEIKIKVQNLEEVEDEGSGGPDSDSADKKDTLMPNTTESFKKTLLDLQEKVSQKESLQE